MILVRARDHHVLPVYRGFDLNVCLGMGWADRADSSIDISPRKETKPTPVHRFCGRIVSGMRREAQQRKSGHSPHGRAAQRMAHGC